MAVLEAYMDESISQNPARVCVVAGYVADQAGWLAFSDRWQRLLDGEGVSAFHATDCESRRGEFSGWGKSRQQSFYRDLLAVVEDLPAVAFASCLVLNEGQKRSKVAKAFADNAYLVVFADCVTELVRLSQSFVRTEPLLVCTIEENKEWRSRLREAYSSLMDDARFAESKRLSGQLLLSTKKNCPPLQLADFFAYESMKSVDNLVTKPEREPRYTLTKLALNQRTFLSVRNVYDLERATRPEIAALIEAGYREPRNRSR